VTTTDISEAFLAQSRRLLTQSYLPRIEQAVEGLSDEQIWWRPNADSNSIGNLLLHLSGNIRQRHHPAGHLCRGRTLLDAHRTNHRPGEDVEG